MYNLSSLLQTLPHLPQSRLVGSGYGLWMAWSGAMNQAASSTLKDYGGICMAEERSQALWFFATADVFRAVARLQIWSRLNAMSMTCQISQATLLVGFDYTLSISLPLELSNQTVLPAQEFASYVHPRGKSAAEGIPGLTLSPASPVSGFSTAVNWLSMHADQGLDYESTRNWYFIIKPLGRMGEKESVMGWRAYYSHLQDLLQRLSYKYIAEAKEGHVIIPLSNFRALRTFILDVLKLVRECKQNQEGYWPTVMVATQQRGMPFTEELPRKVPLDWNKLAPDYPHLQYRDALSLLEWLQVNEIRHGVEQENFETWCNVGLRADKGDAMRSGLDIRLPRKLLGGDAAECFYCGLKNHAVSECPSRHVPAVHPEVWDRLGRSNFDDIVAGLKTLDSKVDPEKAAESLEALLLGGDRIENDLMRGLFESGAPLQLRTLQLVWRSKGKDWPLGGAQLGGSDEAQYAWAALEALRSGDRGKAEEMLKQASLKYMRSYQPQSLRGFVALEGGDPHQAEFHWQEAERLSFTPLQQSYFLLLQGRVREVIGEYKEATALYKKCASVSPQWIEPAYREAVTMVKMGFTGQALDIIQRCIERDANVFNRVLLDPEFDRGRLQILATLSEKWRTAEAVVEDEKAQIERFSNEVAQRFEEKHPFFDPAHKQLDAMRKLTSIRNYVAFRTLVSGFETFAEEMDRQVQAEIKRMGERSEQYFQKLKDVQREAAWFPFPKLLLEFNKDFNFCADRINSTKGQHLKAADSFRRAMQALGEVEERLKLLQKRLVTLRIVRDSTLFVLLLGRTFVWLEIVGLGLAMVVVPAMIFFSDRMPHNWMIEYVIKNKWDFQKGLIIILSIVALIFAVMRTAVSFEKRKRDLFEKAERQEETRVKERMEKRRAARDARATKAAAAKAEAKALPAGKKGAPQAKPPRK